MKETTNEPTTEIKMPCFTRITILAEQHPENRARMSNICTYAEGQLKNVTGAKLIKVCTEYVHAIEMYKSQFPPMPTAHPVKTIAQIETEIRDGLKKEWTVGSTCIGGFKGKAPTPREAIDRAAGGEE